MRKYIFTILLLLPFPIQAKDLMGIPYDKVLHFTTAFTAQTICAELANKITNKKLLSELGCFTLVNVAGAAKELTDPSRNGNREMGDIYANILGSGLAIGIRVKW